MPALPCRPAPSRAADTTALSSAADSVVGSYPVLDDRLLLDFRDPCIGTSVL
jgi:hypothetical protein